MKTRFTIEDLRNGKCAVINDGTLDELRSVLKAAFPGYGISCKGDSRYYYKYRHNLQTWISSDESCLPIQSVKDFLIQEDKK